jgi:hypothetical protein
MTNSNSVSLTLPFAYGVRQGRITALAVPMAKRRKSGPGDLVWVREPFGWAAKDDLITQAENLGADVGFLSPEKMKFDRSQMTLEIISSVEMQVQDVSAIDAKAMGAFHDPSHNPKRPWIMPLLTERHPASDPIHAFYRIWDQFQREPKAEENPWFRMVRFQLHLMHIDEVRANAT